MILLMGSQLGMMRAQPLLPKLVLITHNRKELRAIMNDYVTIIRTNERLKRASRRMKVLYEETEEFYKKTRISAELFELRKSYHSCLPYRKNNPKPVKRIAALTTIQTWNNLIQSSNMLVPILIRNIAVNLFGSLFHSF